ncbi:hypothetical protein KAFR_0D03960 [Kazachstania africana CBS 2517]|uniref:GDP/GTP exchange factor Sec2 N-terminal domain-containing protein n=1 Tax=Kazachstania africana (strain ATCC 22294 / BCRC 22015 / CBS 2517 / CECT 1963 / NBRC 1671 / NRRL Y-8276) TaxID=1071382 RepID=H2AUJ4_KAZAF|nr:hypothetical protein KAFR_0D03960 [Kazachstania africana CBS 2517]CCF58044.1 hypothetical protein KAFR_0D03960 [Kazachstania africana CBS 2517]
MDDLAEENNRISAQVTSLSTQLMESIQRESELEEKLKHLKKVALSQEGSIAKYDILKADYDKLKTTVSERNREIQNLQVNLKEESKLRSSAEAEVATLSQEVEDLTASLFAEANDMVADARREKHITEILNTKLVEQLREKDTLLQTLDLQLKNLKKVLQNFEDENVTNKASSIAPDFLGSEQKSASASLSNEVGDPSNKGVYSPYISTIRYDLALYNEFLKFIAVLPYCKNLKDTSSESKLMRRLINDEIQPILRIDSANGIGWLAKKSMLTLMIDGLVVIEPLSGVNENYQLGHVSSSDQSNRPSMESKRESHLFNYPTDSPPVAVHEPCSFCGENRDDILEHARMHVLKTQSKSEDGSITVTNSYPLCSWCLTKVRQTCEIFAFLRSLKIGTWNLEKVTLNSIAKGESNKFTEVTRAIKSNKHGKSDEKKLKRKSFMVGLGINASSNLTPQVEVGASTIGNAGQPTTNIQRAWVQLCKLRSMLHWTYMGIWSVDESISLKIGPQVKDDNNEITGTTVDVASVLTGNTENVSNSIKDTVSAPERNAYNQASIDSPQFDENKTKSQNLDDGVEHFSTDTNSKNGISSITVSTERAENSNDAAENDSPDGELRHQSPETQTDTHSINILEEYENTVGTVSQISDGSSSSDDEKFDDANETKDSN